MILTILAVAILGAYSLVNRLSPEQQPFVLGLIFGLSALAIVVQGATDAYTARQARLRREAEADKAAEWPGEDDALDSGRDLSDRIVTRAEGRDLAKDRGDRG